MGKLILISGPNGSGKSRFAEQLIAQTRGKRYYIATMRLETEDNLCRIEKHRRQRADLGFTTLELSCRVGDAPVGVDSFVLLEDVSNLLGNAMFQCGADENEVYHDILALSQRCAVLTAVTISGLNARDYEGETADYIAALNRLNSRLFQCAAAAAELTEGIPRWQKGGPYAIG